MRSLIVNPMFEELQFPDISIDASSSDQSRNDQENGSNSVMGRTCFPCLPPENKLNYTRVVLAEVVGTFILMFSVCGIISVTEIMRGQIGLLEYAAAGGLSIIVVVFTVGPISGAHVNPAVTIAFAALGHFPWFLVPFYLSAQLFGSISATFIARCVYGVKAELSLSRPLQGCTAAFWAEFIGTFIIMFLVASLANHHKTIGHLSGIVVGVAIGLVILITGPVSGGSLNPARSLGPAIVSWKFNDIWIYLIGPTTGAVTGGLLHHFLRLRCKSGKSSSSTKTNLLGHSPDFCETRS